MKGEASRNSPDRDGWARYRLGEQDVSTIIMGQSPDSVTYNASRVGLPFFQGKADFALRHPVPKTWCSAPTRIAAPGDILISVRAPVGDVNIADEKCCIGRGIAALRPGLKAHGEFLFYCLLNYKPNLDALGSGAIFKSVNKETLRDFEIQLPPLPEQRAIAGVLAKIQAAVEVQEKIVAMLKELKAATMAKLFREGLRGESLKQSEIGEIPEHWNVTQLGKIAQIGNGSTPKRDNPTYWKDGHIPWLTSAKVHETVIEFADEFVTDRARAECHLPLVRKGSIVVAITGQGKTLGNAALATFDTCVSQHLAYIQLQTDTVLPEFMLFFLQGRYKHLRQVSQAGGSTKGALTCGFLKDYSVPIPPFEEQREIARILGSLAMRLKTEEMRRQALNPLFSSMLYLLMTGRVRVTRKMIALQALGDRRKRRPKWSGKVDEKVLEEIVRRIVEAVAPEKIILFGSAARGEMGPDSDLDLLVVKACDQPREVARFIRRKLIGVGNGLPKDILVVTPEDIEEQKDIPGMTIRAALREGRILYAA